MFSNKCSATKSHSLNVQMIRKLVSGAAEHPSIWGPFWAAAGLQGHSGWEVPVLYPTLRQGLARK